MPFVALICQTFPHTIDGQINDLHKMIETISQVIFKWLSWLHWLSPILGPLLGVFKILLCLHILIRLAMEAIHSAMAFITAFSFSLKIRNWKMQEAQLKVSIG